MRTGLVVTATALIMLFAEAAVAADPNVAPSPGVEAAPPAKPKADPHDPNAVICRTQTDTGSRLGGKRVCATRAQWNEAERRARADFDKTTSQTDVMHVKAN